MTRCIIFETIFQVGKKEFPAHKYILASRSEFFRKQFSNDSQMNLLNIENMKPEAFGQVLKFMYTNHCDFLTQGYEVTWEMEQEVRVYL